MNMHKQIIREDEKIKDMSRERLVWVVMVCSVILNLLLIIRYNNNSENKALSWSGRAAEEAEAVAAISCSGHGRAYLDGLFDVEEGHQACECNSCYSASDCSVFSPQDCHAEADAGDPYFLEPFWRQHASSSAVLVAGWHRMSYAYSFGEKSFISTLLERRIRKLHSIIGNAVTDGRYIVFGAGSTQLLYAAVHSLSSHNSSHVVASVPYYGLYKSQTDYLESNNTKFEGDASLWNNSTNVVELVTSPNNPNGLLNKALVNGSKAIYDHAYYWPHFTAIPAPSDEDLMIFTISKLTGHAGSRFGWALVKDKSVYEQMYNLVSVNTMGVSRDTQMRALRLLDVVLETQAKDIFEFGHGIMRKRWDGLNKIFSASKHFSVQQIPPEFCTFLHKLRDPTPAYAWLRCERAQDTDCYQVLKDAGINAREGPAFGVDARFVRLSIIRAQDDFDMLLLRLNQLVSKELQAETI